MAKTSGAFKCPTCAASTVVLQTRWGADRRRECTGAEKHRFNTTEIVMPSKGYGGRRAVSVAK